MAKEDNAFESSDAFKSAAEKRYDKNCEGEVKPSNGGAYAGGIQHTKPFNKEQSPLGLAEEVAQLMKMPQSLCKQRGCCCRVATFKGSLSYEDIQALAQSNDPDADNARDFVTLFLPYQSQQAVRQIAPEFVDRVRESAAQKGANPDQVSFFHCRFVGEDNRCQVHEDRPSGCRAYPIPHAKTIFHPGCGFEEQSKQNWARIAAILDQLGLDETGRLKQ